MDGLLKRLPGGKLSCWGPGKGPTKSPPRFIGDSIMVWENWLLGNRAMSDCIMLLRELSMDTDMDMLLG
jgi:hypothetical protein